MRRLVPALAGWLPDRARVYLLRTLANATVLATAASVKFLPGRAQNGRIARGLTAYGDALLGASFHQSPAAAIHAYRLFNAANPVAEEELNAEMIARAVEFGYLQVPRKIRHLVRDKDVLDIGCGTGIHGIGYVVVGAKSYTGVDPRIELDKSKAKNVRSRRWDDFNWTPRQIMQQFSRVRLVPGTFENFDAGETFDVALLYNVTEHLAHLEDVLHSTATRLRRDGRLIFNHHNFYCWNGHHMKPKTVDEIDPNDSEHKNYVDWAHIGFDAPEDHYFRRSLNKITLGELRTIVHRHFNVEIWHERPSGRKIGGSRLTDEIAARFPELTPRDLTIHNVFCVARRRNFVPRELHASAAADATTAAMRELFDLPEPPRIEPGRVNAIVICHNEGLRLPYFLKFYQSLGVERFIVVDNGSTDDTAAILDANPAVTRFYSERSFAEFKTVWREVIADTLFADRWVLFPDVDEFLIYPGWPGRDLRWFVDYLKAGGYDALFAPMIDMYASTPFGDAAYQPGGALIEACPYFDTGNYRLLPQTTSTQRWKTPPYRIHGGPRERLFYGGKRRDPNALDRALLSLLFSLNRNTQPNAMQRTLENLALRFLDGCLPDKAPNMSKMPLLRWRPGTRFQSSPHRINLEYNLAPDWGAILHFKYLTDFEDKVETAVEREQHISGSAQYKIYQQRLADLRGKPLTFEGSRRCEDYRSMVRAGLMRVSPALRERLARD